MQGVRRAGDVVRVDQESVAAELGRGARLPGQHQRAVRREDRALLGDEVHAVADGVHQEHVGHAVGGERAGVVVVHVEDQGVPVLAAEEVLDLLGAALYGRGVLAVLGQVVPRRVGEGQVHDLAVPLGMVGQELLVGRQAADDVLRQLGPVDAHDELAVAHPLAEGGHVRLDVGLQRAGPERVAVDAEGVHADVGGPALVGDGALDAVDLGAEQGLTAVHERRGPARGQEAGVVGAEDAGQQLGGDVVRQQREVLRGSPRGVGEVGDAQVGPFDPEHRGGEGQVVVLDHHAGAVRGLLGQGEGERGVVVLVGLPLPAEPHVELRGVRDVVEQVVDEPQRGVRHGVVRAVERRGRDVEHAHGPGVVAGLVEAPARREPYGAAVAVGERGAHPQHVGVLGDLREAGDHAASAAAHGQRTVIGKCERHRAPVGSQQNSVHPPITTPRPPCGGRPSPYFSAVMRTWPQINKI